MTEAPAGRDRVWLVTGCSTGIGRAVVDALVARGNRVVATARRPEVLADLAARGGRDLLATRLDVIDRASIEAALAAGIERFGHVDVLLHCAGIGLIGSIEESSDEEIARVFDVNVFGTISVLKAVLPHLRARRSGHVAVVTSFGAFEGHAGVGIYDASKFGLNGLCEALAAEVRPLGIRVSIIEPGVVKTNFRTGAIIRAKGRIATYDGTLAARRATIQGGYPAGVDEAPEVASALLAALDQPEPPLHLVLGSRATDVVQDKLRRMLEGVARWEDYSRLNPPVAATGPAAGTG